MIKTVFKTALPICETAIIKKNVLKGGQSSKRVCIVTGTHGDELEGQYVAFKLNSILKQNLDKLNGVVDIYPALNPLGLDSITRGVPNFDIDMNRIFPGSLTGSVVELAARHVLEDLAGADIVIDIHSSNIFLVEIPQVRINVNLKSALVPLASQLNMDFIWIHEAATVLESTLAHSLNIIGTKTLVVEMGVGMRINHDICDKLVDGIFNLLKNFDMWLGDSIAQVTSPVLSEGNEVSFVNAGNSGIFITDCQVNTMVKKGQSLGRIVSSLTGEVIEEALSPTDGLLFTIRAYPIVYEGSLLARVHSFDKQ